MLNKKLQEQRSAEEQERLRKIQLALEAERRAKEEEERLKREEEDNRKKKAEMEQRRKQEEVERLRQEEEDRKAALVLQVSYKSLMQMLEYCFILNFFRLNWRKKLRKTVSIANNWNKRDVIMNWLYAWHRNQMAKWRIVHH